MSIELLSPPGFWQPDDSPRIARDDSAGASRTTSLIVGLDDDMKVNRVAFHLQRDSIVPSLSNGKGGPRTERATFEYLFDINSHGFLQAQIYLAKGSQLQRRFNPIHISHRKGVILDAFDSSSTGQINRALTHVAMKLDVDVSDLARGVDEVLTHGFEQWREGGSPPAIIDGHVAHLSKPFLDRGSRRLSFSRELDILSL